MERCFVNKTIYLSVVTRVSFDGVITFGAMDESAATVGAILTSFELCGVDKMLSELCVAEVVTRTKGCRVVLGSSWANALIQIKVSHIQKKNVFFMTELFDDNNIPVAITRIRGAKIISGGISGAISPVDQPLQLNGHRHTRSDG